MRAVGFQNEEQKVIAEVRAYVRATVVPVPTLVLFFSDGGVYRNNEIEQELRAAVEEPVFWQFVGLGRAGFGVLERFDDMPGGGSTTSGSSRWTTSTRSRTPSCTTSCCRSSRRGSGPPDRRAFCADRCGPGRPTRVRPSPASVLSGSRNGLDP